jgi:acetoin:2,6-dichlorophenolindophenol oxidoreductase subunit alpha
VASNLNLDLYHKLYLIRRAEEKIREHYGEDEIKTPTHMSIGEEAIAAGVCQGLQKDDQVLGTYRSHAIFLAKTENTDNFFAELYGKATSLLKGKGGSMHLCEPASGFLGTSAIVASVLPVAVGAAYANMRQENGKAVAVFFGDGAVDEGNFWESLNMACLMKLPLIFVCEDNGYAVHTPKSQRQGYANLTDIVSNFYCNVLEEDTTDAEAIYAMTVKARELLFSSGKPSFMPIKYYRYLEHVGVNEDFDAGYRPRAEYEEWLKKDPVTLMRNKLLKLGLKSQLEKLEKEINAKIVKSWQLAKDAPFAAADELYKDVFA